VDAREAYNNLKLSTRTTFNAVTHALISTQLTGESGAKLGSAIQIVDNTTAPGDLVDRATKFHMAWLVKQDLDEAARYISAECAECLKLSRGPGQPEAKTPADAQAELKKAMRTVADSTGKVKALEEAIVAPVPNHDEIKLVKHAKSKAFVIASIPDYMGEALKCATRTPGEPVRFKPPAGEKTYGKYYATGFGLANAGEDSGVLWAVWARNGAVWELTAYAVLTP